jgi:hypothetical protein
MLELSALDMPLGGLKLSPPGGVEAVGVGWCWNYCRRLMLELSALVMPLGGLKLSPSGGVGAAAVWLVLKLSLWVV